MTPAQLVAFATARHGKEWKSRMADETGYGWWTFYRIEKGGEVSKKLAREVERLMSKQADMVFDSMLVDAMTKCGVTTGMAWRVLHAVRQLARVSPQ